MCTLVTLRPLVMVALTLSISVIMYGPIHWALSLRDLPWRTVSSRNITLSPTCNFISPDFLLFLALTLTCDQVPVGVVMNCLQSASQFENIIFNPLPLLFKALLQGQNDRVFFSGHLNL